MSHDTASLFNFVGVLGGKLGLDMYVFGPETHMTSIVSMALDKIPIPRGPSPEGVSRCPKVCVCVYLCVCVCVCVRACQYHDMNDHCYVHVWMGACG